MTYQCTSGFQKSRLPILIIILILLTILIMLLLLLLLLLLIINLIDLTTIIVIIKIIIASEGHRSAQGLRNRGLLKASDPSLRLKGSSGRGRKVSHLALLYRKR